MEESKAVKYLIDYMKKNDISAEKLAEELGRMEERPGADGAETIQADEFLALCRWLHLRPEEVMAAIRDVE